MEVCLLFGSTFSRVSRGLSAAAVVLVLAVPATRSASAQVADERFFNQTSFRVDNDAFWDFFQHRGSVRTFGYPVSRQFRLDGFRSEEHTSELQSHSDLVCRLLLEKKNTEMGVPSDHLAKIIQQFHPGEEHITSS